MALKCITYVPYNVPYIFLTTIKLLFEETHHNLLYIKCAQHHKSQVNTPFVLTDICEY
jgi:hypothetical protein